MKLHVGFVILGLLALPGCLDPIVGSECADGYVLCHNACVPVGTCDGVVDAAPAVEAGPAADTSVVDAGEPGEAGSYPEDNPDAAIDATLAVDSTTPTLDQAGGVDQATKRDLQPDLSTTTQPEVAADAVPDAPLVDDAAVDTPLVIAVDAETVDVSVVIDSAELDSGGEAGQPCLDCVDAEASEAGAIDGGVDVGLVCTSDQLLCDDQCVDPLTDPNHCGGCATVCTTGACAAGTCCGSDYPNVCSQTCVNTNVDPSNCGTCGTYCASGLCSSGMCEAAGTGRVIVIGHDYLVNWASMNRILGNAVFLWPVNPVQLLVYVGTANATAVAGADTAIAQVKTATGRSVSYTYATDYTTVPGLLASANVFLIYGQVGADDTTLLQWGDAWSTALNSFVNAGGTVIVLDGVYAANNGTVQIVSEAGLIQISHNATATGDHCSIAARGDALAVGVSQTYLCEPNSVSFAVTDTASTLTTVVEDSSTDGSHPPVVVHKTF